MAPEDPREALDRSTLNSDVRTVIESAEDALRIFKAGPSFQNARTICIETRSAIAVFEDISLWAGEIDEIASQILHSLLVESVDKMKQSSSELSPLNPKYDSYTSSVEKRLKFIEEFKLEDALNQ